ncbi:sirohydrochlorin chelatase [Rhodoferax sp.]|uniref:sirohydrochlorin chelatase n=1 Tax=Rhodoferax sp. TaxID=50421 RepID=UPI0008D2F7CE|nr:CbiX/SirB N-terminal domain-containing protein [Rhodoferax sp.]OGB58835.1 MAG: cobalamin biosynthesis protein CbiX [Burkholderiales bacterium RIFOXYD12_FULL_59_19]OGB82539.1 MAG: cobalamin biosynthesis protein CbiX [Burkholderiales bacterium RIFOXYC12_FULL_60_6]OGB83716.1 MAG: cobalamin biosynthesis protein CbiX [Burkholderiales bacterium RIFOXYD2_FULL_59_8]MDO8318468.1 CbiX/SirB N-terminal domain-containing protein [Rhodoferax sp.]MDP2678998.1 CbiX/SirB N-terminal domain-containing protein
MQATILFGHGSRDPLWRVPIDTVAQRMQVIDPQCCVRCAFLEITAPDLAATTAELVALGVSGITIVPMFLGVGRHARDDLPVLVQALQADYPEVRFLLQPSVGEDARVVELLAQIALPGMPATASAVV